MTRVERWKATDLHKFLKNLALSLNGNEGEGFSLKKIMSVIVLLSSIVLIFMHAMDNNFQEAVNGQNILLTVLLGVSLADKKIVNKANGEPEPGKVS